MRGVRVTMVGPDSMIVERIKYCWWRIVQKDEVGNRGYQGSVSYSILLGKLWFQYTKETSFRKSQTIRQR